MTTSTIKDVLNYVDTCLRAYKDAGLSCVPAHMYCVKEMLLQCGVQNAIQSTSSNNEGISDTQPVPRAEKKMLGPGNIL
jgi:hypothetical protein